MDHDHDPDESTEAALGLAPSPGQLLLDKIRTGATEPELGMFLGFDKALISQALRDYLLKTGRHLIVEKDKKKWFKWSCRTDKKNGTWVPAGQRTCGAHVVMSLSEPGYSITDVNLQHQNFCMQTAKASRKQASQLLQSRDLGSTKATGKSLKAALAAEFGVAVSARTASRVLNHSKGLSLEAFEADVQLLPAFMAKLRSKNDGMVAM